MDNRLLQAGIHRCNPSLKSIVLIHCIHRFYPPFQFIVLIHKYDSRQITSIAALTGLDWTHMTFIIEYTWLWSQKKMTKIFFELSFLRCQKLAQILETDFLKSQYKQFPLLKYAPKLTCRFQIITLESTFNWRLNQEKCFLSRETTTLG